MSLPDFSQTTVAAAESQLTVIATLVDDLRKQIATVQAAQDALDEAQAQLTKLQLYTIPDAMTAAGLTELKLEDGSTLAVKEDVNVSVSEDNKRAAYRWLRDHELGSIIKNVASIDLRAAGDEFVEKLTEQAEAAGVEIETKEAIHAATLKATVKELLEKGTVLPPCFSIHEFKKASVKEPKLKGKRK